MRYTQLGRTDISVSAVAFGTMMIGEFTSEAEGRRLLSRAVDLGITLIDTAEMYPAPLRPETHGLTESIVGRWLKDTGLRDTLVISSKVIGPPPNEVVGPVTTLRVREGRMRLTGVNVREAIEGSLRRLGTDYLDLYYPHWPDRKTNALKELGYVPRPDPGAIPIEETLDALDALVREGKVRALGVSNETPWGLSRYLAAAERDGRARIAGISNAYNLLCRSFEVGLAEFAHREDVGLIAYSPLAMGVLSGKYLDGATPPGARLSQYPHPRYTSASAQAATRAYVDLARAHGLDPSAMALGYVASRPFMTSSAIGASTIEQLDAAVAGSLAVLPDAVIAGIEAIHAQNSNPGP